MEVGAVSPVGWYGRRISEAGMIMAVVIAVKGKIPHRRGKSPTGHFFLKRGLAAFYRFAII